MRTRNKPTVDLLSAGSVNAKEFPEELGLSGCVALIHSYRRRIRGIRRTVDAALEGRLTGGDFLVQVQHG